MSISSQVNVPFRLEILKDKPRIAITGHPGIMWGVEGIPLRVYPPNCQLRTSVGSINRDTIREVEIPGDMISWNGQSSFLQYRPNQAPSAQLVWGFDEDGESVAPGTVAFSVDTFKGEIRSNRKFQGLVKIGVYSASYELIWYRPDTQVINTIGSQFPTIHSTYGVIAAFKDGSLQTYEVQIPNILQGTDKIELWRVVSSVVIDSAGEWELPVDWSTTYAGTYPGGIKGPDKDGSLVKERIHELGYITATAGTVWYEKFGRSLVQPYQLPLTPIQSSGTPRFQPVLSLSKGSPTSLFPEVPAAQQRAAVAIAEREQIPLMREGRI